MSDLAERVAARYKGKKLSEEGNTIYQYSERQVALRHSEKAERLEALRSEVHNLRSKVEKDLSSKDKETRLIALAVGLMDHTAERVGNDESAENGHYGVTGWLKKHITFRDGKAIVKYVGKSGVSHVKAVRDKKLVSALKQAYEDADDRIFEGKDWKVGADKVNRYLEKFDITAKDLRGLRANQVMQSKLKELRKGDLPTDPKKKKEQLKKEFEKALNETAKIVGHEPATLRNQYLVPKLEEEFMKGRVMDKMVKDARLTVKIAFTYVSRKVDFQK